MKEEKANKLGEDKEISRCKCSIFSRSMGYIRPIDNFNIGKYSEFCERNLFKEEKCLSTGQRRQDSL